MESSGPTPATVFAAHAAAGWEFGDTNRHDRSLPHDHVPLRFSNRRPNHSARDACRGDSSGDTRKADRGGWAVTAPPGPISKATAATWEPELRAAAAGLRPDTAWRPLAADAPGAHFAARVCCLCLETPALSAPSDGAVH